MYLKSEIFVRIEKKFTLRELFLYGLELKDGAETKNNYKKDQVNNLTKNIINFFTCIRICKNVFITFIIIIIIITILTTTVTVYPWFNVFKGALSGLRQFLATESPLKMMKNAFYITSRALFVLKIFKFLSLLFGHVSKRLD